MSLLSKVPLILVLIRALLGPIMILLALYLPIPTVFAGCLIFAFVSDIFDGKIARRLGVATTGLRRLDSIADSIFYISAIASAWILHPEFILARVIPIGILFALEILRYVFDGIKFKKEASYHMWSSKLWGILLFCCFYCILVLNQEHWTIDGTLVVGIIADLEGLLISMILPFWKSDVPSFVHAFRIRRQANALTLKS